MKVSLIDNLPASTDADPRGIASSDADHVTIHSGGYRRTLAGRWIAFSEPGEGMHVGRHRRGVVGLLVGLVAVSGCRDSIGDVAVLESDSCEELADEYAAELERRTMVAIADADREPEEITEEVWDALDSTFRGLALATRDRLDCDPDRFAKRASEQLSREFRERAPRWLSSEDVSNAWSDYEFFIRDNVQEAIAPEVP